VLRLVLTAVALGLSNLAASIRIGLSGVDANLRVRVAAVFGFFEATMPVVGLVLGHGWPPRSVRRARI
jgi:putative Mn2+ efflux pump MntP